MTITKIYKVRKGGNPEAAALLKQLQARGYSHLTDIVIEYVMRVEMVDPPNPPVAQLLVEIFRNPVIELASPVSFFTFQKGPIREVSYKRSITDPELPTALHACQTLGIKGVEWVRLSKRYRFVGVDDSVADEITSRFLYNKEVQTVLAPGFEWDTLVPQGEVGGVKLIDFSVMSLDEMLALSKDRRLQMRPDQLWAMQKIGTRLGRPFYDGEVEMIPAAWGDHCAHTTLNALGLFQDIKNGTRRINHPLVISAFVDNSGVMRFYGGLAICFKGETHISPTFAGDPYGGIMTKHGGAQRDIIDTGEGAVPICGSTVMATVDPRIPWKDVPVGAFHPQIVVRESIRGTADYNNPMGIPMAYSRYLKDSRNWKGFALGHSVGILPESRAAKGVPKPGDVVLLVGGLTGADGIHGATVSSGDMTSETAVIDSAHVQIGAPIEQRKFMETAPVLRDANCIRARTDCGAAGLASACGEMGSVTGIWINLAWVPLKTAGLLPWQIWMSESQEREVLAIPPDKLSLALSILAKYGVPATVIGVFTDSRRCHVVFDGSLSWDMSREEYVAGRIPESKTVVVDLPYEVLTSDCPLPVIQVSPRTERPASFEMPVPANSDQWVELCKQVLGHYNIADQSAAARRFDQTVQGHTVVPYMGGLDGRMPDELFVTAPVDGKRWGVGVANGVNQFYGDIDPAGLGQLVYVQAVASLVAAGFDIRDITVCANLYTPSVLDSPTNAWALRRLIKDGYVPASEALGVPVITGKDSSSGTFWTKDKQRIDAPLTLDILTVGRIRDCRRVIRKPFRQPGDQIVLFCPGLSKAGLGGSVLFDRFGQRGDTLPELDLAAVRQGFGRYHRLARLGGIHSRSNVAEGGLIRSLFECCIGSGLGCRIDLSGDPMFGLFGERSSAIVFTVSPDAKWSLRDCTVIGEVTNVPEIDVVHEGLPLFAAGVGELATEWQRTFAEVAA